RRARSQSPGRSAALLRGRHAANAKTRLSARRTGSDDALLRSLDAPAHELTRLRSRLRLAPAVVDNTPNSAGVRMKFLYDLIPLLLFFVAFKAYDIYVATAVVIVATAAQIAVSWLRTRRVETMPLVTLGVLVV